MFRGVLCANVLINKINEETCVIQSYRNASEILRSHQHCWMPEHSSGVSELEGQTAGLGEGPVTRITRVNVKPG